MMKLLDVVYCIILLFGCVKVAGKNYSLNRRTVSTVECHPIKNQGPSSIIFIVRNFDSLPLPGSTVNLKGPAGGQNLNETTNVRGEIIFTVTPGEWEMRIALEGFNTHQKSIAIKNNDSCTVHVYLGDEPSEVFQ